jgi:hypothetical protein
MVKKNNQPPLILKKWVQSISLRNSKIMTDFYTDNSILLATYEPLLFGKNDIKKYFDKFLNKNELNCKLIMNYNQVNNRSKVIISSGFYEFSFVSDNGLTTIVDARYSFVFYNEKIVNHHSSETPIII